MLTFIAEVPNVEYAWKSQQMKQKMKQKRYVDGAGDDVIQENIQRVLVAFGKGNKTLHQRHASVLNWVAG